MKPKGEWQHEALPDGLDEEKPKWKFENWEQADEVDPDSNLFLPEPQKNKP